MRLISIADYNEHTMVLGRPVYDSKGRILLSEGRNVHPNIIQRFIMMGIFYLFVDDTQSRGITLEEMFDMPTWMDVIQILKRTFAIVEANGQIPLQSLQNVVHQLLNEVRKREVIVLIPSTYSGDELRLLAHSVNVALLSIQTAKRLGFNELNLRDLTIGALLHDIGKAVTEEESKHPEEGFKILRNMREINLLSSHVAMQHHESLDGTGFPRGISEKSFLKNGQICGLANYYENLVYGAHIPPHEAIEMVMTKTGVNYSQEIVSAFVHSIPSYPPGTRVKLNNGEEAIVTRIKSHMHRPIIRILNTEKEISLADNPTIIITGLIDEKKEITK